jgi:hypothetical protein
VHLPLTPQRHVVPLVQGWPALSTQVCEQGEPLAHAEAGSTIV